MAPQVGDMDSHALVWPLEGVIWTHTLRCGPSSWGHGLPHFGVAPPLEGLHVDMVNVADVLLRDSKNYTTLGVHWVVLLWFVHNMFVVPSSCFILESYTHMGCLDTLRKLMDCKCLGRRHGRKDLFVLQCLIPPPKGRIVAMQGGQVDVRWDADH